MFQQAFCAAPGCSPSRASILTGRNIWQNREAGTHASNFPADLKVFHPCIGTDRGATRLVIQVKPGDQAILRSQAGRRTPLVKYIINIKWIPLQVFLEMITPKNFETFLKDQQTSTKPFFFWFGAHEPHRVYKEGAGVKSGKRLNDAEVPTFLPDHPCSTQ